MVRAGLQGHIGGGAERAVAARLQIVQRHHLGVGLARGLGVPDPKHQALRIGDDAAHARIRLAQADGELGERQGVCHGAVVAVKNGGRYEAWHRRSLAPRLRHRCWWSTVAVLT